MQNGSSSRPIFAWAALLIGSFVFLSAGVVFATSFWGLPETHPLAPVLSFIVFIAFLFEIPMIYFSRVLGFPVVLPVLCVVFLFLSIRKKEGKKVLWAGSIALVLASISMYLALGSMTHHPHVPESFSGVDRARPK